MPMHLAAWRRPASRTPLPCSRLLPCALASAALALLALEHPAAAGPTELNSLLEIRDDYLGLGQGGFVNATVVRGDYAFTRGLSLRGELPIVYAGGLQGERFLGLGDVLIRPLVRVASAPRFGLFLGSDFIIDSAAEPALGAGKNQLAPLAQALFGVGGGTWLGLALQHSISFGGDPKRNEIRASSIRSFAILPLPAGFWLAPDQRFRIDSLREPRLVSTSVLEVGKGFGDRVSAYIDPGVQISSTGSVDWLVTGAVRWVFPRARGGHHARRRAVSPRRSALRSTARRLGRASAPLPGERCLAQLASSKLRRST